MAKNVLSNILEPSLKRRAFERDKTRENLADGLLTNAKTSFDWLSMVLIRLVCSPLAPIGPVYVLLSKDGIMSAGSIILAIKDIIHYIFRSYKQRISYIKGGEIVVEDSFYVELLINSLGIIAGIITAFIYTPGVLSILPTVPTVPSVLFAIYVAATGVNAFFLVKPVLVPPIFTLIRGCVYYLFGKKLSGGLCKRKPFTLQEDFETLSVLAQKHFRGYRMERYIGQSNSHITDTFNSLLSKLVFYLNKYNEQLFGNVRNQSQISDIEKTIDKFTLNRNAGDAFIFIKSKLSFKCDKIDVLKKAKLNIVQAELKDKLNEISKTRVCRRQGCFPQLNATLRMYLTIPPGCEKSTKVHAKQAIILIDREIQREQEKIVSLNECLPPSEKPDYISNYLPTVKAKRS